MSVKVNKTPAKQDKSKSPVATLRDEMNALMDNFLAGFGEGPFGAMAKEHDPFRIFEKRLGHGALSLKADVSETKDGYRITAELPGVSEKDVDVSVSGRVLSISAEKHEEKAEDGENYHVMERHYGTVSRSFPLPEDADTEGAKASFKNGVLRLSFKKKAIEADENKKIPIT